MTDFTVKSQEDAAALATAIRSGRLNAEETESALQAIEGWRDEVLDAEEKDLAAQQRKESFLGSMKEHWDKRTMMQTDIMEATANGEQTYGEAMFQTIGKVGVGLAFDFLGEAVGRGVKAAGAGMSYVTPDAIEDPVKGGATAAWTAFAQSDVGQAGLAAMGEGIETYQAWAQNNPRAARNLEAGVNVAMLLAPVKGKPKLSKSNGSKISDRLRLSADRTEFKNRTEFARDFVLPRQTASVRAERARRGLIDETGGNRFTRREINKLDSLEETAAAAVQGIVDPKRSLVHNVNRVRGEIKKEANRVSAALAKRDVLYNTKHLDEALKGARERLKDVPALNKESRRAANEVIDSLQRILNKTKATQVGGASRRSLKALWDARKQLDAEFRRIGKEPSKLADLGTVESGMSIGMREVRNTINQFVATNARKGSGVARGLNKQSALYTALENAAPKAAQEATSALGRMWNRVIKVLPFRGAANQLGALAFGLGGLGAGAVLGPMMSKALWTGAAGYATYRYATSPAARRQLAAVADALETAARNPKYTVQQARQLRADRAYIMDLIQSSTHSDVDEYATPAELITIEDELAEDKRREENERVVAP